MSRDNSQPTRNAASPVGNALPEEKVGPDDLLEITVPYCPELSRTFRVTSAGSLVLPLINTPIPVSGMLPSEVSERVREALRNAKILNDPVVIVSVVEYRSRPVSVVGAVNHPLTFQATGDATLLDAIARAGGLTGTAGSAILVTSRSLDADGHTRRSVVTVSSSSLLSSSDPTINIHLHGGEEIRVPEAGKVFVAGNVHHPGMYMMQSDAEMTVLKAIALSEGLQPFTAKVAYIYRRQNANRPRGEIKIPLNRIMARKDSDVSLMADDILYVPENSGKKMTSRVIEQFTGFAQTTGSGVLIFH